MIERYLKTRWQPDGMNYPWLNCWGLVRLARHELYGKPLLPAFGIDAYDKKRLTIAAHQVIGDHLKPCEPQDGAIVAAWRGKACVHVGLVVKIDGRLAVLETGEKSGARYLWLNDFAGLYNRVTYYA